MFSGIWALAYPFTAFLFIRGALRSLAAWAARPRLLWLVTGILMMSLTLHAGWHLYSWTAVLPHWWITPLVTLAFAWIAWKNISKIWKFPKLADVDSPEEHITGRSSRAK